MIRCFLLGLLSLLALAACGADGPPESVRAPVQVDGPVRPGVDISGTASIGLAGSF